MDPHQRNELLLVDAEGSATRFSHHLPEDEHRPLSRAAGLRERVQIVGGKLVLKLRVRLCDELTGGRPVREAGTP